MAKKAVNCMNNIKALREKAGLTQEELSKSLNISRSTVAMWEAGMSMPRAAMLQKLAEVLGCGIADLFGDMLDKQDHIDSTEGGECHV